MKEEGLGDRRHATTDAHVLDKVTVIRQRRYRNLHNRRGQGIERLCRSPGYNTFAKPIMSYKNQNFL